MRIKLSALLFLVLNCFHAQEMIDKEALDKCRVNFNKKDCLADKDMDGIPLYLDHCPDRAGLKKWNGCPDTDDDGIIDIEDHCPEVAGVKENKGCPWPDGDGDGVPDKDDECPTLAGYFENRGCPWPDTDKDGVPDKDDVCPTVPGKPEYNGCKDNCAEAYKQEAERLKRLKADARGVNYDILGTEILKNIDADYYHEKDVVILTNFVWQVEAGGCNPILNPSPIYDNQNLWSQDKMKDLSKRLQKNILIGKASQSVQSSNMDIGASYDYGIKEGKKIKYKDGLILMPAVLFHKSVTSKEKTVGDYGMLMLKFTNEFRNIISIEFEYYKVKGGQPKMDKKTRFTYQYLDDSWKVIKKELT